MVWTPLILTWAFLVLLPLPSQCFFRTGPWYRFYTQGAKGFLLLSSIPKLALLCLPAGSPHLRSQQSDKGYLTDCHHPVVATLLWFQLSMLTFAVSTERPEWAPTLAGTEPWLAGTAKAGRHLIHSRA